MALLLWDSLRREISTTVVALEKMITDQLWRPRAVSAAVNIKGDPLYVC